MKTTINNEIIVDFINPLFMIYLFFLLIFFIIECKVFYEGKTVSMKENSVIKNPTTFYIINYVITTITAIYFVYTLLVYLTEKSLSSKTVFFMIIFMLIIGIYNVTSGKLLLDNYDYEDKYDDKDESKIKQYEKIFNTLTGSILIGSLSLILVFIYIIKNVFR